MDGQMDELMDGMYVFAGQPVSMTLFTALIMRLTTSEKEHMCSAELP